VSTFSEPFFFPTINKIFFVIVFMTLIFKNIHMNKIAPEKKSESSSEKSKSHPAVGFVSKPFDYNYNFKDVIIYNLGIGASTKDDNGLQYLYEGNDPFVPIPSFAVIPGFAGVY